MDKSIKRRLERLEAVKIREDSMPDVIELVLVAPGEKPGERRVAQTMTWNLKTGEQIWNPPVDDDAENGR